MDLQTQMLTKIQESGKDIDQKKKLKVAVNLIVK